LRFGEPIATTILLNGTKLVLRKHIWNFANSTLIGVNRKASNIT
jgi:hypothetical protein